MINRQTHTEWKKEAGWYLVKGMMGREPFDGPLIIRALAIFGRPKRIKSETREPHWSDPDGDNVLKIVCDAMKDARVVVDDCIFFDKRILKFYAAATEEPHVYVEIFKPAT